MDERESDAVTHGPGEHSRRTMIKRSAVIGGALLWAAPTVQTLSAPAFAAGSPVAGGGDISFVALLATCAGVKYRFKFEVENGVVQPVECGPKFSTGDCSDNLGQGDPNVSKECPPPPGVTATANPDGSVTVSGLSGCTIHDFIVKAGQCCAGPGEGGEPTQAQAQAQASGSGSIKFPEPSSVCADCASSPPCP